MKLIDVIIQDSILPLLLIHFNFLYNNVISLLLQQQNLNLSFFLILSKRSTAQYSYIVSVVVCLTKRGNDKDNRIIMT